MKDNNLHQLIEEISEKIDRLSERQNSQYTDIMMELKKFNNFLTTETCAEEDLYEEAMDIVIEKGKASTSLLQRALGIGYSSAAHIMDRLEKEGIIGPSRGAKPREILVE
jgi:S-DNA-T family DNA segregation ATPase FtsK/SpoIIIE